MNISFIYNVVAFAFYKGITPIKGMHGFVLSITLPPNQ
jgi:hypothetical protein